MEDLKYNPPKYCLNSRMGWRIWEDIGGYWRMDGGWTLQKFYRKFCLHILKDNVINNKKLIFGMYVLIYSKFGKKL